MRQLDSADVDQELDITTTGTEPAIVAEPNQGALPGWNDSPKSIGGWATGIINQWASTGFKWKFAPQDTNVDGTIVGAPVFAKDRITICKPTEADIHNPTEGGMLIAHPTYGEIAPALTGECPVLMHGTGLPAHPTGNQTTGFAIKLRRSNGTYQGLLAIAGQTNFEGTLRLWGGGTVRGAAIASDARLKDWRGSLSAAERAAGRDVGFRSFRFISNPDHIQVGVIAQEVRESMTNAGLNADDYSMTFLDGDRYIVDYNQVHMLVSADLDARLAE